MLHSFTQPRTAMPSADHLTLTGQLTDAGSGVRYAFVEAYDADGPAPQDADLLGSTTAGEDGTFEISFRKALAGPDDLQIVLGVYTADRQLLLGRTTPKPFPANKQTLDLEALDVCDFKQLKGGHPVPLHHGMTRMGSRGIESVPKSTVPQGYGRFGRLFPLLRGHVPEDFLLEALGRSGGVMDEREGGGGESTTVTAGLAFFGQFVDHDITLDTTSSFERQADPDAIGNFRTPLLELDNVYGAGPEAMPFLYDGPKMLVEKNCHGVLDLPRNSQGRALIGDPRNDENAILAQLQLGFLLFHNAVVEYLRAEGVGEESLFEEAQELVRWHYQWILLTEFLPAVCKQEVLDSLFASGPDAGTPALLVHDGRRFYRPEDTQPGNRPFIPVEFSVAAYRFGHSQIQNAYRPRPGTEPLPLFSRTDPENSFGMGFEPITEKRRVNWRAFFEVDGGTPQRSRKIDTKLAGVLFDLPFVTPAGIRSSLAARNLLRAKTFRLPSGQAVAKAMAASEGITVLGHDDIEAAIPAFGSLSAFCTTFDQTPLWYYILAEAQLQENGEQLGGVGSRIVAEVLVGLLALDERSLFNANPCFTPTAAFLHNGRFDLAALLKVAEEYVSGDLDFDGKKPKLALTQAEDLCVPESAGS